MNATICLNDGDTHNSPVEASEVKSPIVNEEFSLVNDSAGAGKYRGGLGLRRAIRMLTPASFTTRIERTQCAPWGLEGGKDAVPNKVYVRRADGRVEQPPNGKIDLMQLAAGDTYVLESGGGGGFGDPLERQLKAIVEDVRLGYISLDAAQRDYGVVLDEDFNLDDDRTARMRAQIRASADAKAGR
jgi:N-methylhydantoinase B